MPTWEYRERLRRAIERKEELDRRTKRTEKYGSFVIIYR